MTGSPLRLILAAAVILAVVPGAATAKQPTHPSGLSQPLKDGCQRQDFSIGFGTTPEWVYIHKDPTIRMAAGVVRFSHNSLDDAIMQHGWYDFNANLVPGKAYRYLIAGSSSSKTNNFAPGGGEEFGRLHFEWEQGSLPFFAWPTDGDRATIWGSWIWDCGHWSSTENNQPGSTITGEHSELHPLNAIVVNRASPFATRSKRNESQTDVYISNDGSKAHAVEQCALSHKPAPDNTKYDDGFLPCTQKAANKTQPLAKHYSFFVPAPPKPKGANKLTFRVVNEIHGGSGSQKVKVEKGGLEVTVTTKKKYGKRFFVSWNKDKSKPTPLVVTLKTLTIKQADPNPAQPDPTPPTWNLYLNVNGVWNMLNDWTKALSSVTDGQTIALNRKLRLNVPAKSGVWFQMYGRECDEPADVTVFGVFAPIVKPCGPNRDEINPNPLLLLSNDSPGLVLDRYKSAAAAVGNHTAVSHAKVNFPHTGEIDAGHFGDGEDDYELTYSVARG